MNRLLLAGTLGVLLTITACVQQIPRDPTPTPAAGQTPAAPPTPTAMPTSEPPAPTPTPIQTAPTATPPYTQPVQPLFLELQGPDDGTTVRNSAIVVHGRTVPGATVTIGEVGAVADRDGRFQVEVRLEPGANRIVVVASDDAGRRVSVARSVTFEVQTAGIFFLLVTEPEDQSIVSASRQPVSGRTVPDAIVSVNGVGVNVDAAGSFSANVTLEQGPNLIEVVGTSSDGRVLSAVVAVIFRP